MSKVVLKGEFHSSEGDLQHEKELLKQGFDALILEGQAGESEYSWTDGWFQISVAAMFWILGRIYVSKEILRELADIQDTELIFTREGDSDLLSNTSLGMKVFCAALFYTLIPGSVAVGILFPTSWGAFTLITAFVLPVLCIRIYNSVEAEGKNNRDNIIADKIVDAVDQNKDVLVVVGEAHRAGIEQNLPDEIDLDSIPPEYPRRDIKHIKEVSLPFFEMALVIYSLYLIISWLIIQIALYAPTLI